MKNFKRVLSLALAALMVIGGLVIAPVDAKADTMTQEEIIEAAYALGTGEALDGTYTLSGEITKVDSSYSASYNNITVTMKVTGTERTIQCYNMIGDDINSIVTGDVITVTGKISNYKGTVQFGKKCTLDSYTSELPTVPALTGKESDEDIVDAAYALGKYQSLKGEQTLTGVVKSVEQDSKSRYIVEIQVGDKSDKLITCYNLKGTGVDVLKADDEIKVIGTITNYNGTIEFTSGCMLVMPGLEDDATQSEIIEKAYTLAKGQPLDGKYTLTGTITSVDEEYSEKYKNITVTMKVEGTEREIQCYYLAGTGTESLAEDMVITVEGPIMNFSGTVEFDNPMLVMELPENATEAQILAGAASLAEGQRIEGEYTLTGVIDKVVKKYDATKKTITVDMKVGDQVIQCYALSGTGADLIEAGDTITVKGAIQNYYGTVEFDKGTLTAYTLATDETDKTPDNTPDDTDKENDKEDVINKKGDMAMPVALILFAGCAMVAIAVINKRKMA